MQSQSQVFLEIMPGDMVQAELSMDQFPIVDQGLDWAFDEIAETVRVERDPSEQPVERDHHKPATDCRQEVGRAIDRACEDGRENDQEYAIKHRPSSERPASTQPYHDECENENDDSANRDLHEGECLWRSAETQKDADGSPKLLP